MRDRMNRVTFYVGVPTTQNPKTALEDAGATVRASPIGWDIARGNYRGVAVLLGTKTVAAVAYRVFAIVVYWGDQWRAYRWLKGITGFVGPYTRWNAPASLLALLREISARRDINGAIVELGDTRTARVLAGEDLATMDARRYVEGADPSGEQDQVTG